MGIKAIALDIDGTLTNDNKVITERTREALLAAQGEGVKLILSSGRPIQGLRALAAELSLDSIDHVRRPTRSSTTSRYLLRCCAS